MASFDVSRILENPAWQDRTLTVTRTTQTIGTNGLAVNTLAVSPFAGIVTAKGTSRKLKREDAGSRISGSIQIYTLFALTDGKSSGTDADIVSWNGRQYTVSEIEDWSTYGQGFVVATCDLLPLGGG